MESVRLSSQDIEQMASKLQQMNIQMRGNLYAVSQKMRHLNNVWDSPAGEALQNRFLNLLPVFDHYEKVMDQYVSFLRMMVQSYQDAEGVLKQQAETFVS